MSHLGVAYGTSIMLGDHRWLSATLRKRQAVHLLLLIQMLAPLVQKAVLLLAVAQFSLV